MLDCIKESRTSGNTHCQINNVGARYIPLVGAIDYGDNPIPLFNVYSTMFDNNHSQIVVDDDMQAYIHEHHFEAASHS